MSFCRNCGEKSSEDALFCAHCGHRLQPPPEEATSLSDPHTAQVKPTPPPETPTLMSRPLQAVPSKDGEEEEKEEKRRVIPPVVPPELPATGNVPSVQGTPPVGTVPSVPGMGGTAATTLTAGTMAKVIVIAATCAAVIFAGIKVIPPIFSHPIATPTASVTHAKATTAPMPPTQTSCPAQGTARAAVTALLVLGTHQNLVYSTRLGAISNATSYTLKRYDTTTGQTTEIVKLDNTEISNAQISTDGQWVLFTSTVNGQAAIQMIRMDGQGLQTLYCNPVKPDPTNSFPASISSIAWSVDQKLAMFSDNSNNPPTLYLLNLANGTVQKELLPDSASSTIYYPTLWIDATHVALSASDLSGTSGQSIYVLDISKGANQQSVSLQLIVKATTSCLNFDINPAHTKFFLSRCTMDRSLPNFNAQGPSSISVLPVTGGSEQTIFTTQTLGVTGIRVISNTELLVLITTKGFSSGIDSSKNGLYKMHVDGTHLTQLIGNDLIGNDGHQFVSLNGPSATWSIVSRDGRMYALEIAWCGNACTYTLLFGSLSGGKPTTIISGNSINGNASTLVGWTTM